MRRRVERVLCTDEHQLKKKRLNEKERKKERKKEQANKEDWSSRRGVQCWREREGVRDRDGKLEDTESEWKKASTQLKKEKKERKKERKKESIVRRILVEFKEKEKNVKNSKSKEMAGKGRKEWKKEKKRNN